MIFQRRALGISLSTLPMASCSLYAAMITSIIKVVCKIEVNSKCYAPAMRRGGGVAARPRRPMADEGRAKSEPRSVAATPKGGAAPQNYYSSSIISSSASGGLGSKVSRGKKYVFAAACFCCCST